MHKPHLTPVLFLIAVCCLAPAAFGQSGPALMIKPWPDKQQLFDGYADAYFFEGGHSRDPDTSFRLSDYESAGRFRILPGNEISPRIGYDFLMLDNGTRDRRIPDQLTDASLAIGSGIFKYKNWVAGITLGAGYAGSSAFDKGAAWYPKADLIVADELNETDTLLFLLDYDGHRAYLPDTPLPGVAYSHQFDPKLLAVIGLPYSSLEWKPLEHLNLKAEYNLYTDLKLAIGYEFLPHLTVYGSSGYVRDVFDISGLPPRNRLLFYQRRAEVGLRFTPNDNLTFKAGIGYGWDGSYRRGFDFRKDKLVADISDEPFFHVGMEWRF